MKTQNEMQALQRRVGKERKTAGAARVRFSEELKRDVVALAKHPEWSRERLAKALGLAPSVLFRWFKLEPAEARVRKKRAGLTQVRVVTPEPSGDGSIDIEFRCGAKIRGLTVEQLAQLLGVTT